MVRFNIEENEKKFREISARIKENHKIMEKEIEGLGEISKRLALLRR